MLTIKTILKIKQLYFSPNKQMIKKLEGIQGLVVIEWITSFTMLCKLNRIKLVRDFSFNKSVNSDWN